MDNLSDEVLSGIGEPGKNDGGTAFPLGSVDRGMSMRQWYKGQALAGVLASMNLNESNTPISIAHFCGVVADAMIADDNK